MVSRERQTKRIDRGGTDQIGAAGSERIGSRRTTIVRIHWDVRREFERVVQRPSHITEAFRQMLREFRKLEKESVDFEQKRRESRREQPRGK